MNERILELAKTAGLKFPSETALSPSEKKFAELIRADEREQCISILERLHERSGGQYNYYQYAAKVLRGEA